MVTALAAALGAAIAAVVVLCSLHREALRRVLLGTVDPRPLALFRIALGSCLLGYVVEIAPLADYLFSDEGLLPRAAVPQVYGRGALSGYGDGVRHPAGFPDAWSVVQHVAHGRWSLLYFRDDPAFVQGYLVVLTGAGLGMVLGWYTRASTVIAWLLLAGLLRRGDAHWGGEQVMLGLLVPMLFARSGAAFGVDAWRRHRRLARQGRLDRIDRDGESPTSGRGAPPGPAHPHGLEALYPRVPAWPQLLLVAQLAICYCANGWTKAGSTWVSGDTLWLSMHLDRYARLDWHALTVALGPWPFRLAAWSVMWWERLFPLFVLGLWLRASATVGAPALTGRARMAARACWLVVAGAAMVWALWPSALADAPVVARPRAWAVGTGAVLLALCVALGPRRHDRWRPWVLRLLAPRWWLGFGFVFHGVSLVLFEIGTFASATISAYLVCGIGSGCIAAVQRVMQALGRLGLPVPEHLRRATPVQAEDPSLPHLHRDAAALPGWAIAGAGALVLLGGTLALVPETASIAWWHAAWLLAAAVLVGVGWRAARRAPRAPAPLPMPLAHGPAGRLAAGGLVAYHLVSLLVWQLPSGEGLPWRNRARATVDPWMELTFTRQLWSMFAPNGPRTNVTLRTIVVDEAGVAHDLRTELQHPENLRRPYLRHDRWRKVDEAVSGQRKWLTTWHARYLCRHWALEHGGTPPIEVRLARVAAPFPPLEPLDPQAWFREHAEVSPLVTVRCAEEPFGQLAPEVRTRHGMPPPTEGELRYAWPTSPPQPDPLEPLWMLLALALMGVIGRWACKPPHADR